MDQCDQTGLLPPRLADHVREQLLPQEHIIWCGRPEPEIMIPRVVRSCEVRLISFLAVVPWLFLPLGLTDFTHRFLPIAFLLGAGLVAIVFALWSPLSSLYQARLVAYVITDRRFFALCLWPWLRVVTYLPRDVGEIGVCLGPGGTGDVWLFRSKASTGQVPKRAALDAVVDAGEVACLLGDLAARSPERSRPVSLWWWILPSLTFFAVGVVILVFALVDLGNFLAMWYGCPTGLLLIVRSAIKLRAMTAIRRLKVDYGEQ